MPQPQARTFEGMASLQEQLCEEGFPSSCERAGLVASILQRSDWYDIIVRSGCVITFAFVTHDSACCLQDLANMGEVVTSITQYQDILEIEMKWLVALCNRIGKYGSAVVLIVLAMHFLERWQVTLRRRTPGSQ